MAIYPLLLGHLHWPDPASDAGRPSFLGAPDAAERDPARLTVHLPATLRGRVEASAALAGLTPDTWIVRALSRSVDPRLETS